MKFLLLNFSVYTGATVYHAVKNFGDKKVWHKGCYKGFVKKTLVNVDLHCQSPIND